MSELIDRQALRAAHGLGTDCRDCKRDMKSCQYDRDYSLMDFCEWLDDAPTASPWHRVEEELPEKEGDYLVWTMLYGGHAYTDYYTPKYGWDEYKVIAWMPLPEPPKEDADGNK